MPRRMATTPLLIENGQTIRLTRVPFIEWEHDEAWLQDLLFNHPALLPVGDIEPVFAPATPVARELPTPSGPLDILYVTPEGYPTLVETKLWRNPEARRQVVAQAIDYATQMSKWSYDDLVAAVKKVRPDLVKDDPLAELMELSEEEWDQTRFVDTLSRNLRHGRVLILIVGDGIHESVEQMAETLSRTPQLGFTLGLVEMALFRQSENPEPLFVQPRIVARTREVVRAIVEIKRHIEEKDIEVTLPASEVGQKSSDPPILTEEAFFEKLAENASSQTTEKDLREFLDEVELRGVQIVWGRASLSLHFEDPENGSIFSFGSLYTHTRVDMYYVVYYCEKVAIDVQIGQDYLDDVASLVPGARADVWGSNSGAGSAIKVGKRHVTIQELLLQKTGWLAAIDRMISRIRAAVKNDDSA